MKKGSGKKALIIQSPGGWGKTRMAEAICHELKGRYHFISRPDQTRDVVFMPDEALVWDEVNLICLMMDPFFASMGAKLAPMPLHCMQVAMLFMWVDVLGEFLT